MDWTNNRAFGWFVRPDSIRIVLARAPSAKLWVRRGLKGPADRRGGGYGLCLLARATGFVSSLAASSMSPAHAVTPQDPAIVVLYDVSGSIGSRPPGWHEALGRAAEGLLSGSSRWREQWVITGDRALLEAVAPTAVAHFGILRFGTAAPDSPFFTVSVRPRVERDERVRLAREAFPPPDSFHQQRTYVRLAQAVAAKAASQEGARVAYLVVLSDFLRDDSYTPEQAALVDSFETGVSPLRETGSLGGRFRSDPNLAFRIIRLEARDSQPPPPPPPPPPATGIQLLRPLSSVRAGDVEFAWTQVPGALTYLLELRRVDRRSTPASGLPPLSGTSHVVRNLSPGRYRWAVTARNASLQQIARSEQSLMVEGESNPLGALLFAALLVGATAVALLLYRRRKARKGMV